jgi:hypothetical protein
MNLTNIELSNMATHSSKDERIKAIKYARIIIENNKTDKLIASAIIRTAMRDQDPDVRSEAMMSIRKSY